ncbi:FecR family protein [Flavivirga jejuensis]|uniref:FecR domain-containing protein n=1 Tax=Flavivirga jejuensis TaxID=870487 RepID=A0ABT8WMH9_9FLAO|nr:FecR family protein [Flavivirga jejuensis]MDO5974358.1 FecR domain-containing protein [Flavivirga jejuensis]
MDNSNKIKSLSKKLAASLIKKETSGGLEKSEIFDTKTKSQMLMDIKEGKRLELLKQIDTEKDWKVVKGRIQRSKRSFRLWSYGIAASVVLLISITFVLNNRDQNVIDFEAPIIVNNNIEKGIDKAILTLEDGSEVTLEKGTAYQTTRVTSNGEEIIYEATNNQQSTTNNYNTLTIPRGGQFYIVLSDGTKVWLNSESQLKYPVAFTNGETRQVELVYGEAYFDVSPSTAHKGAKFKVFHQSQEVEVLGTEFNIKAYKGETNIYTTLVEGKVAVSYTNKSKTLVPNQQLSLNLETNNISVAKVDIYNEVAWKDGVFSFESMPLNEIMKVLSRWYDMDVIIENTVQKEERFIGTFNKSNSIEDILMAIKSTNVINNYEINDKTLVIR